MHDIIALMLSTHHAVGMQILTVELNGLLLLLIIIIIGAYIGWSRGIRAILTVALVSIIAYLLCIESGYFLVRTINRFYQNGPRLLAFAVGRDPSTVPVLDPLIEPRFTIPLFFRFVLFIVLILFAWFFRKRNPWYAAQPSSAEPLGRPLGAFVGGIIALIWTAALLSFWIDLANKGKAFGGPIAAILYVLPDITPFMPAIITIFFLFLIAVLVFILPRSFAPVVPAKK